MCCVGWLKWCAFMVKRSCWLSGKNLLFFLIWVMRLWVIIWWGILRVWKVRVKQWWYLWVWDILFMVMVCCFVFGSCWMSFLRLCYWCCLELWVSVIVGLRKRVIQTNVLIFCGSFLVKLFRWLFWIKFGY